MKLINSAHGVDRLVERYHTHLKQVAGLSPGTCAYYTQFVRQFLMTQHERCGKGLDLRRLSTPVLLEYLTSCSTHLRSGRLQQLGSALRSFFRFLVLSGQCGPEQVPAIPAVKAAQRLGLPDYLTEQELARLFGAVDRRAKQGGRDHAVLLCLARLGLRAGEVSRLSLEDMDWRQGTVCLRQTKGGRRRLLPLMPQVGEAIAQYLERARPPSEHRQLFLELDGQKPLSSPAIAALTKKALLRAKIQKRRSGPHLLRHTLASHLIQKGASLKGIADLLGHRHLDTTTRYVQVNLPLLAQVVQPWPGEGA